MEHALILGLVLIVAGLVFLAAELFLPTGGILSVLALACEAVGVAFTFQAGLTYGLLTLLGVFITLPVLSMVLLHFWPRTPIGRQMFLTGADADATMAELPYNQELERLKGRIGRTLSALRPAGVVDFDGRRVDTVTEGMMIEPGQWVRCIDVRAGRVVVRSVDKPTLPDLETADFG
jgi:membrane-bound serine protease (ClpP class)